MAGLSLCVLAAAVPAWWVALYASETVRGLFVRSDEWGRLQPFLYADVGLTVVTGVAAVRALGGSLSGTIAGLAVGAWGYSTLWTVGAAVTGVLSTLGAALMLAAFALVSSACHALVPPRRPSDR
jgi:hypothetical protein